MPSRDPAKGKTLSPCDTLGDCIVKDLDPRHYDLGVSSPPCGPASNKTPLLCSTREFISPKSCILDIVFHANLQLHGAVLIVLGAGAKEGLQSAGPAVGGVETIRDNSPWLLT